MEPPEEVIDDGVRLWSLCLVGQFTGKKLVYNTVRSLAKRLWGKSGLVDVLSQGSGLFSFIFSREEGLHTVLDGGP